MLDEMCATMGGRAAEEVIFGRITTGALSISDGRLALATLLILVNVALSAFLRLGLGRTLLIASTRMVVQLLLVGSVLEWLFHQDNAPAILLLALVMALIAERDPAEVGQRYFHMLVRGASRVRAAAEPAPADRRRAAAAGDVALTRRRQPYARFFSVEEYDLAFRRFDGAMSETVNRAVFITGDAATVLPYDPHRDRVLLIEQFRSGPYARGDRNPWLLEPVAGRIDPGETPEAAARREAREEAGLEIGALHLVGRYYPSPGVKSEFLYSYVGIAELPDTAARIAGVDDEAEDIRGHVLDFAAFMDIAASSEAAAAPVLISALWLERNRAALRAGAPPSSVSRG
jgi:nudix-type nucleoside diphosphatase (YffH/AdpP family)